MSKSEPLRTWDGYAGTGRDDGKQVDKSLQHNWPPGTFSAANTGHAEQPKRTLVYPPKPPGKKKRGKPRKAK